VLRDRAVASAARYVPVFMHPCQRSDSGGGWGCTPLRLGLRARPPACAL